MLLIELVGGSAVAENSADIRIKQNARDIVGNGIFDAAVARTRNLAGGDDIPQRDAACEQHFPLFADRFGERMFQNRRQNLPEAVLRMPVKESALPGLYRWEASEDKNF